MADTWITDITHFLDEVGDIIAEPAQSKLLAEYFAAIIMMASFPDPDYPPEYRVSCRSRTGISNVGKQDDSVFNVQELADEEGQLLNQHF